MSDRFLRRPEVERQTGLSRSSIYRLMELPEDDPLHLPRPRRIARRAVAWPQSEIDAWKARRPASHD
jgi:prophage regulatory protein